MEQHCIFLDNVVEANNFNERFRHALLQSYGRGTPLDIAIVGGGATGVQLAAELHKALEMGSLYNFTPQTPEMRVTLLEAGPRILPSFPEDVSEGARKQLEALKISVRTGAMVSGVDEKGFILKDGSRVDAQFRVWAAGVKAPDVTRVLDGLDCARGGQLVVKPNLQTTQDDRILLSGTAPSLLKIRSRPRHRLHGRKRIIWQNICRTGFCTRSRCHPSNSITRAPLSPWAATTAGALLLMAKRLAAGPYVA